MTDEQDRTATQQARIDFARRDLASARIVDLAQLDAADLILLNERLLTRLDDMLSLIDEIVTPGCETSKDD